MLSRGTYGKIQLSQGRERLGWREYQSTRVPALSSVLSFIQGEGSKLFRACEGIS